MNKKDLALNFLDTYLEMELLDYMSIFSFLRTVHTLFP